MLIAHWYININLEQWKSTSTKLISKWALILILNNLSFDTLYKL